MIDITKYKLIVVIVAVTGLYSYSQSLDNIREQEPILVTGFVSTNQIINHQSTESGYISDYSGYYTGSLNISLYGMSVPLTFMYTNKKGNFTHPFNQLTVNPSYKWLRTYIGYSSMSFSPYSLSGHLFFGFGFDVDPPGLFRGSAMYGRLQKAVDHDTLNANQVAAFKRLGYGIKAGIGESGNFVDVSLFRAFDDTNSVRNMLARNRLVSQENTVISVSFNRQLLNNLVLRGEYASSYMTSDLSSDRVKEPNAFLKPPTWFMPVRATTISRNAFRANLTYRRNFYSLGLGYERVDPEYNTLGAYYFTNNMENMTMNFTLNLLESKVTLGGNTGLQRNDLNNTDMNKTKRVVGAGTVSFVPDEKVSLNLGYSNFSSFTNVRSTFDFINETDPFQNFDTLNFRQISQNTNFAGSYNLGNSENTRQTLNLNLTWQVSKDRQGIDSLIISNFYNSSLSYVISFSSLNLTCNASINFNRNDMSELKSNTWGPIVGASKMFFEKRLRVSLTASYNTTKSDAFPPTNIYNTRLGFAYSLHQQHNFSANFLLQQRQNTVNTSNTYNFTFGYSYNFNLIRAKSHEETI